MAHVARGHVVVVIAGKEKGKRGKVLRVLNDKDRVVVERVMLVRRHTKPSQREKFGGIIEKEAAIHVSNVALWCEKCKTARQAQRSINESGNKIMICKKCGFEFSRHISAAA